MTTIRKTVFLPVAPAIAWDYLTKSDKLAMWFYPTVDDMAPDTAFEMVGKADDGSATKPCWGKVMEMHPHSHLRYEFSAMPMQGALTEVDWRLEATDGGTTIHLVHSGFENADDAADGLTQAFDAGWDRHIGQLTAAL